MRTIEEIDKDLEEAWENIHKLKDEKKKVEFADFPDMINKFWKIEAPFGWTTYIHVYSFFKSGNDYIIRGNGFEWEVTPYWDATSMHWNWGKDIFIPEYDIKNFFKEKVTEITKEEFKQKYSEMIKECTDKFNEITEINYEED